MGRKLRAGLTEVPVSTHVHIRRAIRHMVGRNYGNLIYVLLWGGGQFTFYGSIFLGGGRLDLLLCFAGGCNVVVATGGEEGVVPGVGPISSLEGCGRILGSVTINRPMFLAGGNENGCTVISVRRFRGAGTVVGLVDRLSGKRRSTGRGK